MAYLNKVMLIGNIGKDPTIKALANGKCATFSLATTRRYKVNGESKEQTDWHNIVVYGKLADTIEALNVRKGSTLYVEGTISKRGWTDTATGLKKFTTEVKMDNFQLLTPRNSNGIGNDQQGIANDDGFTAGVNYGGESDEDLPW